MFRRSTRLPFQNIFECQDSIGTEAPIDFVSRRYTTEQMVGLTPTTIQLGEKRPANHKS